MARIVDLGTVTLQDTVNLGTVTLQDTVNLGTVTLPGFVTVPHLLYSTLVAYWAMDEASGVRADAANDYDLSEAAGTLGSGAGLVYANAALYPGTPADTHLSLLDDIVSPNTQSFWFGIWHRPTVLPNFRVLLNKLGTASQREYNLSMGVGGTNWLVSYNGTTYVSLSPVLGSPTLDEWNFWVVGVDLENSLSYAYLNGVRAEVAYPHAQINPTLTTPFRVGSSSTFQLSGLYGPLMYGLGYAPTDADVTWMYNAGAGRTLAEMAAYQG